MSYPMIIQGGMGVAVSGWTLARAVSKTGQLGVVSGTALSLVLCRRLQLGDPDGQMRHALAHFPVPGIAARVLSRHYLAGGKSAAAPYKLSAMPSLHPGRELDELTVAANFAEVFLAKEKHDGLIGINFLEKIQLPTLPSIFGAMLADVDFVLMGAGIPRSIPGVLDRFARGEAAELKIDVEGAAATESSQSIFDPAAFCGGVAPSLKRPHFLAVVSSATLAMTLARKSNGPVNGFVVEGETAGGHNAPPRGPLQLSPSGEPVYGPRDVPELDKIRALGLPFWLGGSYGRPGKLAEAKALGAAGIQVGTAFAYCNESGLPWETKHKVIEQVLQQAPRVFTDPSASPTGFPFKVMQITGTLSDANRYAARQRICDLGFLRQLYRKEDGSIGYRCPAEPVDDYVRKGGHETETAGRKCICNGLMSAVGLGQMVSETDTELSILTAGDAVSQIVEFLQPGSSSYSAADVVAALER